MTMDTEFWAHPTAIVEQPSSIGAGTKIWHFSHVMPGARIGARCSLGQNSFVGGRAVVGDGCKIQNNVSIYDAVVLEDDVFVGPSAVFTNVVTPRAFIERKHAYAETRIERGASIGANATIVCGRAGGRLRPGRGGGGGHPGRPRLRPGDRGAGPPGGLGVSVRAAAVRDRPPAVVLPGLPFPVRERDGRRGRRRQVHPLRAGSDSGQSKVALGPCRSTWRGHRTSSRT